MRMGRLATGSLYCSVGSPQTFPPGLPVEQRLSGEAVVDRGAEQRLKATACLAKVSKLSNLGPVSDSDELHVPNRSTQLSLVWERKIQEMRRAERFFPATCNRIDEINVHD